MPEIGQTISHYRVIGKLGAGGMGEVFLTLDDVLARKVALKFLPDVLSGEPDSLARIEREAKLLAALNHQNIATIYGLEEVEGKQFLAMEVVEGETLAPRIDRGPIGLRESAEIARQIAEALEAAHEKGIIHRDLKPANVKIAPDGKVKLLDFGLACRQSRRGASRPTRARMCGRSAPCCSKCDWASDGRILALGLQFRGDLWRLRPAARGQ
jgi:serine/threonine-protein kinase